MKKLLLSSGLLAALVLSACAPASGPDVIHTHGGPGGVVTLAPEVVIRPRSRCDAPICLDARAAALEEVSGQIPGPNPRIDQRAERLRAAADRMREAR